jgi:D-alanyl-lipoteichoic acid acyltransferase DltB (MBOAT superfamily)
MTFTGLEFAVFFAVVLTAYWRLPRRGQNVLLLVAGYVFYGWVHPWFCLLLAASTVMDFAAAAAMERFPTRRGVFLAISLTGNLGMLAYFKYAGFFAESARAALASVGIGGIPAGLFADVALPVGISFITFQSLSYVIDVWRGDVRARTDFLDFAVFVSLFPQLVAGPIERAGRLLPQVERPRGLDFRGIETGVGLMAWGLFKKTAVADNLSPYADRIFELREPGWPLLAAGALTFAVQIFADFSGYCDIARGSARLLGFELMDNFDAPYAATNPSDFWRRWHISLSNWFRDYVYIPLGGSRSGTGRFVVAAVGAMTLSGLWHGASANFVAWGLYHGVLVTAYHLAGAPVARAAARLVGDRAVTIAGRAVMLPLTLLGWVIFRQHDGAVLLGYFAGPPVAVTEETVSVALGVAAFAAGMSLPMILRGWPPATESFAARQVWLWASLIGTLLLGREGGGDFIYFAF